MTVAWSRRRHGGRVAALATAIVLVASACSGGAGTAAPSSAPSGSGTTASSAAVGTATPTQASAPITLTIWSPENRPDDATAHQWLIQQFEAANPNITVQITTTSWDAHFAKIDAAAAAGNLPDIVYTWQPNTAALMAKGMLADITDVYNTLGPDNFPAGERQVLSQNGKMYAIPFIGYPHALWYRKDWFSQAGLQAPQSWTDIVNDAKALTNSNHYGICLFDKGLDAYYVTDLMLAAGAQAFDAQGNVTINSPATVNVLNFIKTINDQHLTPAGWTAMNMDDAKLPFIAGKCAMKIDSASFLGALQANNADLLPNVGVVPIPLNGGQYAGWAGTSQYGITAASPHQAAAKAFLEFMFQAQNYTGFIGREVLGFVPEFKPVADGTDFYNQGRIKPLADIYKAAAKAAATGYAGPTYGDPSVSKQNALVYNQQVYSEMGARIEQGQSPQSVAAWAATRIAELLKGG